MGPAYPRKGGVSCPNLRIPTPGPVFIVDIFHFLDTFIPIDCVLGRASINVIFFLLFFSVVCNSYIEKLFIFVCFVSWNFNE